MNSRTGALGRHSQPDFYVFSLPPLTDCIVFAGAVGMGVAVGLAHIISFGCAALLRYLLLDRPIIAAAGRGMEPKLHLHLLVVNLAVLFLRGGVLALCMLSGWVAHLAILPAIAVTVILIRAGHSLCLNSHAWSLGSGERWRTLAFGLMLCSVLLRLVYCGQVELLPEEAYYWNYAQHLDLGYLDHPPMVAWLIGAGTALCGDTELGVRLGALLCGVIASGFVYRLTYNLFDEVTALVALVIMQLLPFFFFSGILMTPDAPLTASWAALLYFLERALLAGRPGAWWGAGIALGLGLLSKYTIAMVVPAAFIFMVWDVQARRWLRHWLPYAALALAGLIFTPVIYWNATHEWASFAFQTARRLAEKPRFSLHKLILSVLVLLTPAGAVSLATSLWGKSDADGGALRRRRFMLLAVLLPLTVFFLFSLRHEVKLDWTGTLWLAAVPALAWAMVASSRGEPAAGLNAWARAAWPPTLVILVLIYGAAFHYLVLGLPGAGYSEHIELVPVGWRSLAEQVAAVDAEVRAQTGTEPLVVGMDRYAIASELAFYSPDRAHAISQTSSDHLFGGVGLMYERWSAAADQVGRTLLLVGYRTEDVSGREVESRVQGLGPVREGMLARDGRLIRRYYYRIAYAYLEAPH
jgi:dolichol-phosphate mannosyltransferase